MSSLECLFSHHGRVVETYISMYKVMGLISNSPPQEDNEIFSMGWRQISVAKWLSSSITLSVIDSKKTDFNTLIWERVTRIFVSGQ